MCVDLVMFVCMRVCGFCNVCVGFVMCVWGGVCNCVWGFCNVCVSVWGGV